MGSSWRDTFFLAKLMQSQREWLHFMVFHFKSGKWTPSSLSRLVFITIFWSRKNMETDKTVSTKTTKVFESTKCYATQEQRQWDDVGSRWTTHVICGVQGAYENGVVFYIRLHIILLISSSVLLWHVIFVYPIECLLVRSNWAVLWLHEKVIISHVCAWHSLWNT